MKMPEVRAAVLRQMNRMSLDELRRPSGTDGGRSFYPAAQILKMIAQKLPAAEYEYIRDANRLVIASLEAAIDRALDERLVAIQQTGRRRRRR